jgi:hypothetical protein
MKRSISLSAHSRRRVTPGIERTMGARVTLVLSLDDIQLFDKGTERLVARPRSNCA